MSSESVSSDIPSVDTLVRAALSDHPSRWDAFKTLARHGDPASVQALANLTPHRDWTVRRAAISALAKLPEAMTGHRAVLAALQDSAPFVQRGAILAAGELGLVDALPRIRAALREGNPYTRETALEALDKLWHPDDFDVVWRIHRHDPEVVLRKKAGFVLRAHIEQTYWHELFEVWRADPIPRHRLWAIELAAEFGTANDAPGIEQLAQDQDGHVRRAASQIGLLLLNRARSSSES